MMRLKKIALILAGMFIAVTSAWGAVPNPPDERLRSILMDAVAQADSFNDRYEAEVWLLDMSQRMQDHAALRVADPKTRVDLLKSVHYEATRAKLPPELVLAVIDVESRFNRWAISNVGAQGLMQIMPFWLKEIGRPRDNLFDTKTNLRFGCTILRYYLDIEQGNMVRALGRYNGSLGSWKYPNLVFGLLRNRWYKR